MLSSEILQVKFQRQSCRARLITFNPPRLLDSRYLCSLQRRVGMICGRTNLLCSETLNRGVTCNTNVRISGDNKLSVAAAFSHSAAHSSCLCFSHSWRTPPTRRPHLPLARLFRRKSCVAQRCPILPVGEHPPLSLLGYSQPQ